MLLSYARQILRLNDELPPSSAAQAGGTSAHRPADRLCRGLPAARDHRLRGAAPGRRARDPLPASAPPSCERMRATTTSTLRSRWSQRAHADSLAYSWTERPIWVTGARTATRIRSNPVPIAAHPNGCAYRARMIRALDASADRWRIAYMSPGISGLQKAVKAGFGVSALTRRTLLPGMRVLTEATASPLCRTSASGSSTSTRNLSAPARMLVNHIVQSLHDSGADRHHPRPPAPWASRRA